MSAESGEQKIPGRVLAIARDYSGIHAACRARAEELNISRATLDAVSGLESGYAGKLLASIPVKRAGPITLPLLLGGLGLALAVVEDPDALERIRNQLVPRDSVAVRRTQSAAEKKTKAAKAAFDSVLHDHMVRLGRSGGMAAQEARSMRQRHLSARKAARARWLKNSCRSGRCRSG